MDVLNFSASERVDLTDLNYVAQETPLGFARELGAYFALGAANAQKAWVVAGFGATNPTGNQIQVALGSALLGRRVGLDVFYGVLTASGDATQAIDVSAFQSGTYGVYVTFLQAPSAFENRTFWQAGATPGEYAQNVATRLQSTWQMTITGLNPGPEWLQVATLTLPGNQLTDTRPLYFEGNPAQNYASNWGQGANDRDPNRAAYGVTDLQTMTAALRTAIEDVKGPGLTRWWENKIGGQNIGFAGTPVAGRTAWGDANFYAQGSTTAPAINFDATSALGYTRASQTFNLTPGGASALLASPGLLNAPAVLTVGTATQLKFSATAATASAFFAPGSASPLFEQRATNASISSLGFYAQNALAGLVDTNRNWTLGQGAQGYAYPTSAGSPTYAALTVADSTGQHLLRLDSTGQSGVTAIASMRANNAATYFRLTPLGTSLPATYSFQLSATPLNSTQAVLGLGSSARNHIQISQADDIVDCTSAASVKAQSFVPAVPFYDTYPSIYNARVAPNTTNGTMYLSQSCGYVAVSGTPNAYGQVVIIPAPLPNNATVTSVYLNFWRSSSNSSGLTSMSLWASKFTSPSSTTTIPTALQLGVTQQTFPGSQAGHVLSLTGLNITPGAYFNYFVAFGDYDSQATNYIVSAHIFYQVPALGLGVL